MSADRIRVTVDGEPATREVSWDDVRAYLRARGWEQTGDSKSVEWWTKNVDGDRWKVGLIMLERRANENLASAIANVAYFEGLHPSAVLRGIARGTEPTGVEALSEEEIALAEETLGDAKTAERIDRSGWQRRLLATVRAREAERDAALKDAEALRIAAADMLGELALNPQAAEAVSMLRRKLNAPDGT